MSPAEVFRTLCDQPRLPASIGILDDSVLARLIAWLEATPGECAGVRGLVLGLAQLEAAIRFVKANS